MDVTGAIRRHPGRTAVVGVVGLAALVFGFLWFRPDRLFTEDRVNEALPGAPAAQTETAAEEDPGTAAGMPGPSTVAEGEFISLEHQSTGRALIVETATGGRFLRFDDFETSNGPDLVVYLSAKTPAGTDDWHGYDRDFVDLGVLKGNIGDQNYDLPEDVDLDRYSTAVVWCRRFEVGFAAAALE
ncbi:MAG: DM13 domain-containing protein [Actinomycetota bacterium]